MSEELKVKRESLAERCEICHQSDQFDPATNLCTRCELVPLNPDQSGSESELNQQDFKKWATGCAPIVISMLAGIFSSIVFVSLVTLLSVGTRSRNKLGTIIRNSRRAGQVDPIFVGQAGLSPPADRPQVNLRLSWKQQAREFQLS
ncbi:MAG: hypothetical protein HY774_07495, partial [Acidobacteria bacterium]|nr:hypothetical protein [Acidobacteriota bacterium]